MRNNASEVSGFQFERSVPGEIKKEYREHRAYAGRSRRDGRSTIVVECPYCGLDVECFVWSLAGSGKRCPCGAKHIWYGLTVAPETEGIADE